MLIELSSASRKDVTEAALASAVALAACSSLARFAAAASSAVIDAFLRIARARVAASAATSVIDCADVFASLAARAASEAGCVLERSPRSCA